MLTKGIFQHSCLLPHWEQTGSCFHLISCHQPFVPLVSHTLGNLCKFWKKQSIRAAAAQHIPYSSPLEQDRSDHRTSMPPHAIGSGLLVALQDRGAGIQPVGSGCPTRAPAQTPELCVSQTGQALRELLKNHICKQTESLRANTQRVQQGCKVPREGRRLKRAKGMSLRVSMYLLRSLLGLPWSSDLAQEPCMHCKEGAVGWDTNIFIQHILNQNSPVGFYLRERSTFFLESKGSNGHYMVPAARQKLPESSGIKYIY